MQCNIMDGRGHTFPRGEFDRSSSLFFPLLPLSLFPPHVPLKDSQMSHMMKENENVGKLLSLENTAKYICITVPVIIFSFNTNTMW